MLKVWNICSLDGQLSICYELMQPGSKRSLLSKPEFSLHSVSFPKIVTFREEKIFFGHCVYCIAVADFGNSSDADLIVAQENRAYYNFKKENVPFISVL